jgi:hypothetical protein
MTESQPFLLADPQHQSIISHIRRNNTNLFMSGVIGVPLIYFFHTRSLKHLQSSYKWGVTGLLSLGLLGACVRLLRSQEASEDLTKLAFKAENELRGLCKELEKYPESTTN